MDNVLKFQDKNIPTKLNHKKKIDNHEEGRTPISTLYDNKTWHEYFEFLCLTC